MDADQESRNRARESVEEMDAQSQEIHVMHSFQLPKRNADTHSLRNAQAEQGIYSFAILHWSAFRFALLRFQGIGK